MARIRKGRRRGRRTRRRGRRSMGKMVRALTTKNSEITSFQVGGAGGATAAFPGVVSGAGLSTACAVYLNLNTLATGTQIGQRKGIHIQFSRIWGSVWYSVPATAVNNGSHMVRYLILKVKEMPTTGTAQTSRTPTVGEVFRTQSPTAASDMLCGLTEQMQVMGRRDRNYTIVKDVRRVYQYAGTSMSDINQLMFRFSIKVPLGQKTTYSGDLNTEASVQQNCYILMCWIDGDLQAAPTNPGTFHVYVTSTYIV